MRKPVLFSALALAALLVGCDQKPETRVAASQIAGKHPRAGELWPVLLQHCLRSPGCDPASNFGEGTGEASGLAGDALWFAETPGAVAEGGEDYGGSISISLIGPRGEAGPAGRPLAGDEIPSGLRVARDRRTWLTIGYRMPAGEPEPYDFSLRTALIALRAPPSPTPLTQEALEASAEKIVSGWRWPDGATGARVTLKSGPDSLWTGYSDGLPSTSPLPPDVAAKLGAAPWIFFWSLNLRDEGEGAAKLLEAIREEAPLLMVVESPAGVVLQDAIRTTGFNAALSSGAAALADPAVNAPLTDRCVPLLDAPPSDWSLVPPALQACDSRTLEQKRLQGAVIIAD